MPFSFPLLKKPKYQACESSPIYSSRVSSYVRLKLWQRILRKLAIASFFTLLANNTELFSAIQVSWSILKELKTFRPLQPSSLSFNILMLVELALSVMGDCFVYEVLGFVLGLTVLQTVWIFWLDICFCIIFFLQIIGVSEPLYMRESIVLQAVKEIH